MSGRTLVVIAAGMVALAIAVPAVMFTARQRTQVMSGPVGVYSPGGTLPSHGFLGVQLVPPTMGRAEVRSVTPGSGADVAGIVAGDVITTVEGVPVANVTEILSITRDRLAGETIRVTVERDGATHEMNVRLIDWVDMSLLADEAPPEDDKAVEPREAQDGK